MGKFNNKIFTGLIIFSVVFFSSMLLGDPNSQLQDVELKSFITPKYNAETKKLEYILTGKNAETVGTFIKIEDVKIVIIGSDGESITTVITTPEAFYDRVADYIKGEKPVHYRSLKMDGDGIGFRYNNVTKVLHINKDVELTIYSDKTVKAIETGAVEKDRIYIDDDSDTQVKEEKISEKRDRISTEDDSDTKVKEVMLPSDKEEGYNLIKLSDSPEEIGNLDKISKSVETIPLGINTNRTYNEQ